MKYTIEVKIEKGEIESYIIPFSPDSFGNLKITLTLENGLSFYSLKEKISSSQLQYYLGFLIGVCYGKVMGEMLIEIKEINGVLVIEFSY